MSDYYKILGVEKDATSQQIKKAYRKLAMKYHPDQNQGDKEAEEKFKEISEAYSVLIDDEKRSQYDRFGKAGPGGNPFAGGGNPFAGGGNPFAGGQGMPFGADIFGDILNDLFSGGRRGGGRTRKGADLQYDLKVSFEEVANGVEKEIEVPKIEDCPVCDATGARPGTKPQTCTTCGGSGQLRVQQGFFQQIRPCHTCKGKGAIIVDPCQRCEGSGRISTPEKLKIDVPPGVAEKQILHWAGKGEPGFQGGPPGDLKIVVHLQEHEIFTRKDNHVLCDIPISFPQAALGCEVEIPTLNGKVKMKVPEGTQSGKVFRLRKKGFPDLDGRRNGDQLVTVKVTTPTNLTARQKELLREFAEESGDNIHPEQSSFLGRMKSLFGG